MCRILVESGCDLSHLDSSHKMASHYAKKYGKNEVFDYLTAEYQNLKDQKKIQTESHQESNIEDRGLIKKKKREINLQGALGSTVNIRSDYRLYRSDVLGNSTEVTQAEFEELLDNYP